MSNEKKYEESIKKYETILEKYPNFIPAINNIGLAYEYLGLLDKSVYYYKLCCDKSPKEKLFFLNRNQVQKTSEWKKERKLILSQFLKNK